MIRETVSIVGSVESPRTSKVGSEVEGLVENIFVDEGDPVKKGQPLVQLLNSQLRFSIQEAKAVEDEALKELLELKAGSRLLEIKKAHDAMKEARSLWEKANKEYKRNKKLFNEGVVDKRLLINSELEAEAAERVLLQRKSSYELSREGTREEKIAKAQATLMTKKARVNLLLDRLTKTRLTSPFDGVVAEKLVEKGEWVSAGQQVFRVFQVNPVWITLLVPETVVSQVSRGTDVSVELEAFPGRTFTAKVDQVIPEANQGSRTYPVRLLLKNNNKLFKIGMMASGIIPFGAKREALLVPQDAITVSQGQKIVYVVDNGIAKMVSVKTGTLRKGMIEVTGDIKPGDMVVTRGGERLRPGMPLKILNSGP